jgi:hypothetical protein
MESNQSFRLIERLLRPCQASCSPGRGVSGRRGGSGDTINEEPGLRRIWQLAAANAQELGEARRRSQASGETRTGFGAMSCWEQHPSDQRIVLNSHVLFCRSVHAVSIRFVMRPRGICNERSMFGLRAPGIRSIQARARRARRPNASAFSREQHIRFAADTARRSTHEDDLVFDSRGQSLK